VDSVQWLVISGRASASDGHGFSQCGDSRTRLSCGATLRGKAFSPSGTVFGAFA